VPQRKLAGESFLIQVCLIAVSRPIRLGLHLLLEQDSEIEVVAEAASVDELHPLPSQGLVVWFDPVEPYGRELSSLPEEMAVLVLSDDRGAAQLLFELRDRPWGVLPVDATPEELSAAVVALDAGLVVMSPPLLEGMLVSPIIDDGELKIRSDELLLTEREMEVLQLLADGLANKQIAQALGISAHTAKFHVSSILSKLGATNRAEAVRLGLQNGLIIL
jgi:DNA-binding NarL/FixJ family response regulator